MDQARLIAAIESSLAEPNAHANPDSPLRKALSADATFAEFDGQVHFLASSWSVASHQGLAYWLITRSQTSPPASVVTDLERYIATDTIRCAHVMAVGGVIVQDTVALTPEIDLLPFDAVGAFFWASRVHGLYKDFHQNYRPAAALVERKTYKKEVRPPNTSVAFPPDMYLPLEDARRCMTAIGPSCPVWLGNWTELEPWIPSYGSGAAIPNPFETGGFPREAQLCDWGRLPALYGSWNGLPPREQRHLRVPLDRLNRSLRNVPTVDVAIELGVAIDALFLAEREADRGEQTLTLRLRAARFLANDVQERRRLGKLFGVLYRARSMAVHAGTLKDAVDGHNTDALLKEGQRLTALALERIITIGEPDWLHLLYT